jgi:NADPH-dependent 2,4-dienoyl-CoA reductase/sulfur reductase-like enzyme
MLAVVRPVSALRTPHLRFAARIVQHSFDAKSAAASLRQYSSRSKYDAVVIGAGPGGLTCVGNLLDQGLSNIAMIDDSFTAGRINARYREVPSNTKTVMFEKWASGTQAFQQALKKAPNAHV